MPYLYLGLELLPQYFVFTNEMAQIKFLKPVNYDGLCYDYSEINNKLLQ